jgi:rhodanese-related sulfurtransferase
MKRYKDLLDECCPEVREIMPWDLAEQIEHGRDMLILDVREPYEFQAMHMPASVNVPRGILESAVDYGYEETMPELVEARERYVVVVCRSGYRSLLAAKTMKAMGYANPVSLKTGLRGWKDYEQPLVDGSGNGVDLEDADAYFTPRLRPEQLGRPRVSSR